MITGEEFLVQSEAVDPSAMSLAGGVFCLHEADAKQGLKVPLDERLELFLELNWRRTQLFHLRAVDSEELWIRHAQTLSNASPNIYFKTVRKTATDDLHRLEHTNHGSSVYDGQDR